MVDAAARKILIVDDEFASLEVLALLLRTKGYVVLTASDGEEAFAQLEVERVDLVITDYMMPKMNGIQLSEMICQDPRLSGIPIILMSATYRGDIPPAPQIAVYLSKPLRIERLLVVIRETIGA